ncbi:DUF6382 domain-containing protein [Paenibacillus sp. NPDC056579]|uniref:DUF6382 domain-containing protein n=1 Tax=Paenibacillus sp. NPDC056579 TaxID=3345871 RepID=UPI0036CEA6E9
MFAELYGLKVDYVNQQGHYMVLSTEKGLDRDELSAFQLNMLLANRIPHLLELQVEELNRKMKLYYHITDKRMLSHWLRMHNLTMKHFYHLMYTIADTLSECGVNMLQERSYIIHEDYIYCGSDLTDIYITYIPMELAEPHSVQERLQQLASRLVHKVTELAGSGYQELVNYLMDESFHLATLKQLLLRHMNGPASDTGSRESSAIPEKSMDSSGFGELNVTQPALHKAAALFHAASDGADTAPAIAPRGAYDEISRPDGQPLFAGPEITEAGDTSKPANKMKLPMMLIGVLGICLSWKLYLDHPSEGWLYISSGLSLLTADLVYVMIWLRNHIGNASGRIAEDGIVEANKPMADDLPSPEAILSRLIAQKPVEASSPLASFLMGESQKNAASAVSGLSRNAELRPAVQSPFESMSNHAHALAPDPYYQSLEQRTTLLSQPDATVLLSSPDSHSKIQAPLPYMELLDAGTVRKISLDKPCFVIGRGGKGVDYEHQEHGVSRLHAEIVNQNGTFGVKDLGSRNGTRFNGEWMVPYKVYELKEGDKVTIVGTDFTFKMGL